MDLKKYLIYTRLSQKDFALKLKVSQQCISGIITGRYNASIKLALRIEKLTQGMVDRFDLLGEKSLEYWPNMKKALKEKTEKEKIEDDNIPYVEIIEYFNQQMGTYMRTDGEVFRALIRSRFSEGFTAEDFKKVIRIKRSHWINDEEMKHYLVPRTLFCKTHFETYLNQSMKEERLF